MGKTGMKLNIPMCAALVLLILTMISIHMTSGLFARYTASSTGSDSARVAKFDVDSTLVEDTSTEGKFTLTVTNNSEVTVQYTVVVESAAPLGVKLGTTEQSLKDVNSVTFTNPNWVLAPNGAVATHDLQFSMADWTYITKNVTGAEASDDIGFTVEVTAQQVD